jgi:Flp pilus assembly protein TadG
MKPSTQAHVTRLGHRQRGVAMVEFVIGTPLLFLLLYAICELGNALVQYSMLTDTARDADRYLASNALLGSSGVVSLSPAVTNATQNLVVYGNVSGTGAPLLPGLTTGQVTIAVDASNNVSVSVAYPYQSLFGGVLPLFVNDGSINTGSLTLNAYNSMVAL